MVHAHSYDALYYIIRLLIHKFLSYLHVTFQIYSYLHFDRSILLFYWRVWSPDWLSLHVNLILQFSLINILYSVLSKLVKIS